ncbi:S8 family peptidase [Anoxybacteroides rupiense]|uniref:S8 family peptidase n=1 Tax=Anoxybacteroides rupiense TaxID=311460 RepID=UPI001605BFC4|nr:S8 family peptidase [Anoxybacillus rupiensis]MBB3909292.1 hypothetical protein [Anoxybacillus rupiensis]
MKRILALFLSLLLIITFVEPVAPTSSAEYTEEGYIVTLKNPESLDKFSKEKFKDKKHKRLNLTNSLVVSLSPDEAKSLKKDSEVAYIEKNAPVSTANNSGVNKDHDFVKIMRKGKDTYPWGISLISSSERKIFNNNKVKVNIAVLDTGIANHEDLVIAGGTSFVEGTTFTDDNGHGTHVAGTIGAILNSKGVVGVARGANLYSVKVLDKNGQGTYAQLIQGIEWAINNDIDIISLSLGGTEYSEALYEAIKKAYEKGILIVAAAGNSGDGDDTVLYPAKFQEVVSVGAIGLDLKRATFSSVGKIDIVAPGVNVLSTTINGDYGVMSGTSMAVPHVTGSLALILEKNKKLSNEDIKEILFNTATKLGNKREYGHGVVNLVNALGLGKGEILPPYTQPEEPKSSIPMDELVNFDIVEISKSIYQLDQKLMSIISQHVSQGSTTKSKILTSERELLRQELSKLQYRPKLTNQHSKDALQALAEEEKSYYQNHAMEYIKIRDKYKALIESYAITSASQPTSMSDTYEPNNSASQATNISTGTSLSSYISTSSDVDFFKFVPNRNGSVTLQLYVPSDKDYDVQVLNSGQSSIASGTAGTGMTENVTFSVVANQTYYIKVYGYSGAYSSAPYTLSLSNVTPEFVTLYTNSPVDVSLPAGEYQVYKFTPTSTGTYKFYTGPYSGTGPSNDTVLELYSDANLSSMISSNDDSNGTLFSEIKVSLNAGETYYLKLRPYSSSGQVYARLTVTLDTPEPETIYLNSPKDINLPVGGEKVYKFTPSASGSYKIYTDYYGGNSSSGTSDTVLYVYSDYNLTNQIGYNDDSNGRVFSELILNLSAGTSYYIKVKGYNNGSVYARLNITNAPPNFITMQDNSYVDLSIGANEKKYFKFTAPRTGFYRFYTSSYQQDGTISDTVVRLYSDENLTNELAYSDDMIESVFSKVTYELTAGVTYYVSVSAFGSSAINTRFAISPNLPLYIKKDGETEETLIGSYNAQKYPYGDLMLDLEHLTDEYASLVGNQYVVEDGKAYFTRQSLSYNMDILQYEDRVLIIVPPDPQVMEAAQPYEVPDSEIETYANASNCTASACDFTVVLAAGMLTNSSYFKTFIPKIINKYASIGKSVRVANPIFPYGKTDGLPTYLWPTLASVQLQAIIYEAGNSVLPQYTTGTKVRDAAKKNYRGGKIVLIGHSGGGVSSIRGAQLLKSAGYSVHEVVQVGSPHMPLSSDLASNTTFMRDSKVKDWVTKLGFWTNKPYRIVNVPQKPQKNPIDIHANYFSGLSFTLNGVTTTNADQTLNAMWPSID